jgi:hypothetical protein
MDPDFCCTGHDALCKVTWHISGFIVEGDMYELYVIHLHDDNVGGDKKVNFQKPWGSWDGFIQRRLSLLKSSYIPRKLNKEST